MDDRWEYQDKNCTKLHLSDDNFFIIIDRGLKYATLFSENPFARIELDYKDNKKDSQFLEEAESIYIMKNLNKLEKVYTHRNEYLTP